MQFKIIIKAILKKDNLQVEYNPGSIFVLDNNQRPLADEIWAEKTRAAKANKIILYNGNLYKLIKLDYCYSSNTLSLSLGGCSYKDYVATRTGRILNDGGRPVFADPLAICSAIITADQKVLIGKRTGVDGSLDKYHVVGGFIEQMKDDLDGVPCPFEAMRREVEEEVGIQIDIDRIICLGVIYDNAAPHPEMCFVSHTSMPYNKIVKLKPLDKEVAGWEYIDDNPDELAGFIEQNKEKLAVPGLADLLFYLEHKYGHEFLPDEFRYL